MKKKINSKERFLSQELLEWLAVICRSLIKNGYGNKNTGGKILAPSRKELNLLDINEVENWFNFNKPSVVVISR